ncbi:MAG: FGGY family carbohydrate kinase [Bacteroidota bacterium]
MLLLGIDIGTSSIKVSIVDTHSQDCVASAQYPDSETPIESLHPGWAEQDPEMWWRHVQLAIQKANASKAYNPKDIVAIGIAYQMHGLVMVDHNQNVLRSAIIWCDSRAVQTGDKAFHAIGEEKCLSHLLNSPGNFTASKLAWVKENEPEVYAKATSIMLPGDFIAMKLTGEITTSSSALSEGIFWDFKTNAVSEDILEQYGFEASILPVIKPVFSAHGSIKSGVADALGLKSGITVTYKAGDQPNNALSLNVMQPGEVAATAGTSGVIYGVGDTLNYDIHSRVNSFAHVNHTATNPRIGTLLCINGTGIANSWTKKIAGNAKSYNEINTAASNISIGSNGLSVLPFGNGAERMLVNKTVGAHFNGIDFNTHTDAHLFRAVQEGIAFSFRYGLDILKENGIKPNVIRAGKANMFLSNLFADAFVNTLQVPVELYANDGSVGAALGAGIGAGIYKESSEAFQHAKPLQIIEPAHNKYEQHYQSWLGLLNKHLLNVQFV